MKVKDRVVKSTGEVGYVERMDDQMADVRWLTPDNQPSCCVSLCWQKDLTVCGDNVLPQPRNKQWKAESERFTNFVLGILKDYE